MSPGTRVFVYGFLALFLVTGVAEIDAWPLSGWELFSRVRTARQVGWEAVTVDRAGAEHPVPFASLSRGYRGGPHLFAAFRRFSPGRIDAACQALVAAVRERRAGDVRERRRADVRARRAGDVRERRRADVRARRAADVRALRVYRTVRHLSLDSGGGGPVGVVPGRRTLLYECGRAPEAAVAR